MSEQTPEGRVPDDAAAIAMEQTTPESRVLDAAIRIAADAPRTRGTYVSHAKIYWPHITELRAALDALGIQWRG